MVQSRNPSWPTRIWRVQPWVRNPLLRMTDRIEGAVRLSAVLVALAAVPVAGAAGTAGYSSAVARIAAENSAKTPVTAMLSDDPVERPVTGGYARDTASRFEATVRWDHDGRSGQDVVEVPADSMPGDTVVVWLSADGSRTVAPVAPSEAVRSGIDTALGVLALGWLGAAAVIALTHWGFGVRHRAAWAREWRALGRPLGQDT